MNNPSASSSNADSDSCLKDETWAVSASSGVHAENDGKSGSAPSSSGENGSSSGSNVDEGDSGLLDRLAYEFAERCRRGERPSWRDCAAKHPRLASAIGELFPLLQEIESHAVSDATTDFRSSRSASPMSQVAADGPKDRVGDYRILRVLGRGGMGVVYEAEQISLRRRVALKVLPNRGSHQLGIERFRREARAAARLHHTNIVPVFEAGQDGDVHYFAMQLIAGRSLNEVVDEVRLTRSGSTTQPRSAPRDPAATTKAQTPRADADVDAASPPVSFTVAAPQASSSASGSSSSSGGGDSAIGAPKLGIDPREWDSRTAAKVCFQAAEALAHAHERGIVHRDVKPSNLILDEFGTVWVTDFGLAKTEDDALTSTGDLLGTLRYIAPERFSEPGGPKSDIYALGLTLYELAALQPAFDERDRLRLIERVKNDDPARLRSIDPRISADLETIVVKAIDKDPRRRYATAREMADDLKRFLNGEPIAARRIGAMDRVWRWTRRQPALASALVALIAMAMAGMAGFIGLQASHNSDLKRANGDLSQARKLAEEELELALKAVKAFYGATAEDVVLNNPELQPLRLRLLSAPQEFYEQLLARLDAAGADDAVTRDRIGNTLMELATINYFRGSTDVTLGNYRKAAEIYESLTRTYPDRPRYKEMLARCLVGAANVYMGAGRAQEAEAAFAQAEKAYRELIAAANQEHELHEYKNGLGQCLNNLGLLQRDSGRFVEARKSLDSVLKIMGELIQEHPDADNMDYHHVIAKAYTNLGVLHQYMGDFKGAEEVYRHCLPIHQNLANSHPEVEAIRVDLATTYHNVAVIRQLLGRLPEAEEAYREAMRIRRDLTRASPTVASHQLDLSYTCANFGVLLQNQGRLLEAEATLTEGLDLAEKATRIRDSVVLYQEQLANSVNNLGALNRLRGRKDQAERLFREALRIREKIVKLAPQDLSVASVLALSYANIGLILMETGRPREALPEFKRAEETLLQVLKSEPKHAQARAFLSNNVYYARAIAWSNLGEHERAVSDLTKSIESAGDPASQRNSRLLRTSALSRLKRFAEAANDIDAIAQAESPPLSPPEWYNLACAASILSAETKSLPFSGLELENRWDLSETYARKSIDFLRRSANDGFFRSQPNLSLLRTDPDLSGLRGRPDFETAVNDFLFPADPFQH